MVGFAVHVRDVVEQALTRVESLRQRTLTVLLGVAFWTAIILPFLYLPMLVTGLQSYAQSTVFLVLIVLNALTLLLGHPYSTH